MKQDNYSKSTLNKGVTIIVIATFLITAAGLILDIVTLSTTSSTLLVTNIVSLVILIIAGIIYLIDSKKLRLSFSLIIYAFIGNVIFSTFAQGFSELSLNFFLRDTLFIMLFLTMAALVIHKRHAFIIAAIYLLTLILFTLTADIYFLKKSLVLIIAVVSGYALLIRYFVVILTTTIQELEEQSALISKQSELLETKNLELVEHNKTKDKFISILAHDLRNPFNTILGFSRILIRKFDNLPDEKKKDYLQNIQVTTEKTFNLLNSLLDWVRSQSGSLDCNPEKIEIDGLLKDNIHLLAESASNKKISMRKEKDADFIIYADKAMVNTIIRNILSNAIKFTPEKGEITAGCYKSEKSIDIVIRDTGIGMAKEELDQLFAIDRKINRPGTSNESGSGLGLLLCKDFAEKCGGTIRAESEVGKGSSFIISYPIVDSKKDSNRKASSADL